MRLRKYASANLYLTADRYYLNHFYGQWASEDKTKAVWFSYLANNQFRAGMQAPVRLRGLQPGKQYRVEEVNVLPDKKSPLNTSSTYSGDFLMTVGLNPAVNDNRTSVVVEITEAGR